MDKGGHAFGGDLELFEAGGEAAAEVALAAGAEGTAGDAGDFFLLQQADGKFLGGEAGGTDAGEGVEGAAGEVAGEAHLVEGVDDEIAADAILVAHVGGVGFAVLDGFEGGLLADDAGAEHRVLVDAHHGLDEFGRTAGVADAEAGHGVSLGKAVQEDGAFGHAGQRGDADMLALEGEFRIDLVGEDDEVVAADDVGDIQEFVAGHGAAGGIGGEVEHERLAARGDGAFEGRGGDGELVFGGAGNGDGDAVGQGDAGAVADVAGFVVDDFVAGIDDSAEGEVEGLGDADGDEDLGLGIVLDTEVPGDAGADGFAEGEEAEIGGVAGVAVFESVDGGFADVPRGDEVGFADAEGNDAFLALDDVEEFANAGAGNARDMGGDGTVRLKGRCHLLARRTMKRIRRRMETANLLGLRPALGLFMPPAWGRPMELEQAVARSPKRGMPGRE